jgi:mRNA interferase MazF
MNLNYTMNPQVGELFWLKEDSDVTHPHVVIEFIDDDTAVVVAITTNMKKANMPGNVILDIGEGGLEKQSFVDVSKELTVDRSRLTEYIGKLSIKRIEEIINGIGFIKRSFLK